MILESEYSNFLCFFPAACILKKHILILLASMYVSKLKHAHWKGLMFMSPFLELGKLKYEMIVKSNFFLKDATSETMTNVKISKIIFFLLKGERAKL